MLSVDGISSGNDDKFNNNYFANLSTKLANVVAMVANLVERVSSNKKRIIVI